ncbi:6915_t:CDS:2 [Funneliformis mosseae]|uniref:6915_t:CDS:1 n=1 Tax=Funneliformis mosseae TaxID=27381 RepID=A0A9N9AI25_FUNMO|nr:6915_t:CDS:2 [Funneliformis mosseae]
MNIDLLYIVNSEIGVCSCPVGMSDAPYDLMVYAYIALGYVAENKSFYATLHAQPVQQKASEKNEEIDIPELTSFLEVVKSDYQNSGQTFQTALDKFKDRYNAAKSKSLPRLTFFLYDLNRNLDPMVRVKSGANIRFQVESIKRRKTEGGKVVPSGDCPSLIMMEKRIRTKWLFQSGKEENRQ